MRKVFLFILWMPLAVTLIACASTLTPTPSSISDQIPTHTQTPTLTLTPYPAYYPSVDYQLIADFNETCQDMGAAASEGDSLENSCIILNERIGKVAELHYRTPKSWAAFWLKLRNTQDLMPYDTLVFFAKSEPNPESLPGFKIEFWDEARAQHTVYTKAQLTNRWTKFEIPFKDFECLPDEICFDWTNVHELVFTFEKNRSGANGIVYLDDIYVERQGNSTPTPPPPVVIAPMFVANFDNGISTNLLGGQMGPACPEDMCPAPNRLIASFVFEEGALRLEYAIKDWVAFWIKLQKADLSRYSKLQFTVRADREFSPSQNIKIELKRGDEIGILRFGGITQSWQTREVLLADFKNPGWGKVLSGWTDMDELIFTLEAAKVGGGGILYLDNIQFIP